MKEFKRTTDDTLGVLIFAILIGAGTESIFLGIAGFFLGSSLTEILGLLKMILNQNK
jgi:hypothetical protein